MSHSDSPANGDKPVEKLEVSPGPSPELPEDIGLPLAATLGPGYEPKADRIAAEVRQAARSFFGRPPEPRPSSFPKELRALLKLASKGPVSPPDIGRHLWPYLFQEDEVGIEELCASPADLTDAIRQAIELADQNPETEQSRKGGRHRDPRINAFVMALAQIYRHYTNQPPTVTTDPETGNMVSPFTQFAYEAFFLVYRNSRMPEGAIQSAIRDVVGFERKTKPMGDEELSEFLPPSNRT